jgi:hypothetical protein
MRFYKIDCRGELLVQRAPSSTLIGNTTGRFLWDTDQVPDCLVINDGTGYRKIWDEGNDGAGSGLDADLLDGNQSGNSSGQIPISNGTICTNLNADLLDGYHAGNASGQIPISNGVVCNNLNAGLFQGENSNFYRNASNINAGTLAAARLSGTYNISISGNAATATTATAARYS